VLAGVVCLTWCGVCACRQHPQYIPASTLGSQIHRWSSVLLAQLFRGAVDLGRPADASLYHLGCFQLVLPDGRWVYLAAVVLNSLQQQQQHSLDEMLEAFRQAGAVLQIRVPKCKQCSRKRSKNGDQVVDWLPLRKHILPPELSLLCPTRTLAFCMAAMWWAKGAVTARLLTLRKAGTTGRAAPKRRAQRDFQGDVPAGSWRVPSSRDLASFAPALYLLQHRPAGAAEDDSSSDSDGSDSEQASGDEEEAAASGSSTEGSSGNSSARHWLAHTKPRKGSSAQVLLRLRALSGSDLRDSQQVTHTTAGGPKPRTT